MPRAGLRNPSPPLPNQKTVGESRMPGHGRRGSQRRAPSHARAIREADCKRPCMNPSSFRVRFDPCEVRFDTIRPAVHAFS